MLESDSSTPQVCARLQKSSRVESSTSQFCARLESEYKLAEHCVRSLVALGRCLRGAWEMEDWKLYEYLMVAIDCAVLCFSKSSVY